MLPTSCVVRSYCFSFSGAFMALVYSPDALRKLRIIGREAPRHRAAQQLELVGGGRRRQRHLRRGNEIEARDRPDVELFVDALQAEAPAVLLPREKRLAGDQRARIAARRD